MMRKYTAAPMRKYTARPELKRLKKNLFIGGMIFLIIVGVIYEISMWIG